MSLPSTLLNLRLPVVAAPLFIISNPDLVIAQCKAGIVGAFPALNAREAEGEPIMLERWLKRITEELDRYNQSNPDRPAAPFAVNQIVHRSNTRLERDIEICARWKVPVWITSLGARVEVNEAAHSCGGITLHDVINICLYGTWQMDNNSYLALMQSLTPPGGGDVQTQDERAEGSAMMTFFEDGRFESVFNGFTVYSTLVPDGGPTMQIELRFSGGSNGTYAASGDQLSTTVTASTISAVSYMNGQVVGTFPGNAIGTIGGGKYICSDAQLLLGPNPPQLAVNPNAPWLTMNRVTP